MQSGSDAAARDGQHRCGADSGMEEIPAGALRDFFFL